MKPFVITVDFHLHAGRMAEFLPLVTENARLSKQNEPGCRRFDVLVPHQGSDWLRLYEIYDGETAMAHHRTTPHYLAFRDAIKSMIASTIIERFELAD